MRFVFSLVLLLCISSVHAQIERYTLKNGLTVILNEDHTMPQVFGAVAVKAGSKNDPADATGLAHYQEHMLFKGTETLGTTNWEKEKVYIDSIFIMYDKLRSTDDEEERTRIQKTINRLSVAANEYAIPNEFDKVVKMMGGTGMNAFTAMDMTVYFNAFPGNQIERWLDLYAHRFKKPVFRSFQAELEVVYEEKNMRSDNFFLKVYEEFSKEMFPYHPYG
ncbi:MAG: insulinase family protein, partial [Bacteroidetes bacterium]|nr:insulinase family protein [Bacteroidota bacterium]